MASFETVVRPVVFPNIRPQSPRVLPPEDDPTKGQCVIRGNPAKSFNLSYSYNFSASSSSSRETEREVDTARVYQENDDGTINRENFVDIEVAARIRRQGANLPAASSTMSEAERAQRERQAQLNREWEQYYRRVQEQKNIEIRKRNEIQKNEDQ